MPTRPTPEFRFDDFLGAETTAAVVLQRGHARLAEGLGRMVRFAQSLVMDGGPGLPTGPKAAINRAASHLLAVAGRTSSEALAELRAARSAFREELKFAQDSTKLGQQARAQFEKAYRDAVGTIGLYRRSAVTSIRTMRYWGLKNLTADFGPFPLPQSVPEIEVVWTHKQRHRIGGVVVPVTKSKLNLKLFGIKFNVCFVQFQPPGVANPPPAKGLGPTAPVKAGGRTITALDTPGVEFGNLVAPAAGGNPEVRFYGYMKVIYVTDVPAGCSIRFQTVASGSAYTRAGGAWHDAYGGKSGQPVADPPGGGPNHDLGGGMWGFSDFPNSALPPNAPVCTYQVRDELFRTWVVEFCPNAKPKVLGYWEWSFREIKHMGPNGVESITSPPPPAGVPPPPGGWPNAPGSGPTSWVDATNAPKDAANAHKSAFPESYPP